MFLLYSVKAFQTRDSTDTEDQNVLKEEKESPEATNDDENPLEDGWFVFKGKGYFQILGNRHS